MDPCPSCGDTRPNKARWQCRECLVISCAWCYADFHALGVHPNGRTMRWREPSEHVAADAPESARASDEREPREPR